MSNREKISDFLLEYVRPIDKRLFTPDANLTDVAIKAAVELLLEEGVFKSPDEMKRKALRGFNVILPDKLFENK